jgi:hypothetical protein
LNSKLQRAVRDIERTKAKIEELQALLPELERRKTELENAEVIKVFRSANVAPGDFAAFIAAYRAQPAGYPGATPGPKEMEASDDE